jgi:hypothetical protein
MAGGGRAVGPVVPSHQFPAGTAVTQLLTVRALDCGSVAGASFELRAGERLSSGERQRLALLRLDRLRAG